MEQTEQGGVFAFNFAVAGISQEEANQLMGIVTKWAETRSTLHPDRNVMLAGGSWRVNPATPEALDAVANVDVGGES